MLQLCGLLVSKPSYLKVLTLPSGFKAFTAQTAHERRIQTMLRLMRGTTLRIAAATAGAAAAAESLDSNIIYIARQVNPIKV